MKPSQVELERLEAARRDFERSWGKLERETSELFGAPIKRALWLLPVVALALGWWSGRRIRTRSRRFRAARIRERVKHLPRGA